MEFEAAIVPFEAAEGHEPSRLTFEISDDILVTDLNVTI
jgi:hypothetical protein